MGLLAYYISHTFVNSLKKMFRTWLAVVLMIVVIFGFAGVGMGLLLSALEDSLPENEILYDENGDPYRLDEDGEIIYLDEEGNDIIYDDEGHRLYYDENDRPFYYDEEGNPVPLAPGDIQLDDGTWLILSPTEEWFVKALSALLFLIGLLFVLYEIFSADSTGSGIFTMPDVNLLFTAPLKPQAVIQFRLIISMGGLLLSAVYLMFQVPNLVLNLHMSLPVALSLIGAWVLLLVSGQAIKTAVYLIEKAHKPLPLPLPLNRLLALACGLGVTALALWKVRQGNSFFVLPLGDLFGIPALRWVPFIGWICGFVMFGVEGNWLMAWVCFGATLSGSALLSALSGLLPADFYEDALPGAERNSAILAARSSKKIQLTSDLPGRKKPRKARQTEQMTRSTFTHGQGAEMFLLRNLYHRRRSCPFGLFTTTCTLYTLLFAGYAAVARFVFDFPHPEPLLAVVAYIGFFRSIANPISAELDAGFIYLVPEPAEKKLLYSLLSGTVDCLLNLLPGTLLLALIQRPDLLALLSWFVLLVTLDFMVSGTGLAANLLLPGGLPELVYGTAQLILLMLSVLPMVALLIAGLIVEKALLFTLAACGYNLILGLLMVAISPGALEKGRK